MRFTIASGTSPLEGFTIKRGVGIGGFGEVYFAISDSGKEVALKRIARNLDVELRGVRQCLNLKHANLIGLWDIKKDDLGESWVVMEYVSGPSLRDEILANENGLPVDDIIWWFQGISAGVHYLHQNGIVHRDLKPGNIFQDNEAQLVKIGDYGLSKFISGSKRSGHTESVGTVHYMAPEIGRGIYGREIDIYSLGVILFELITGKVPFDGESTQEIIMKHMTAQVDVSPVPSEFQDPIAKCLVKDPADRYSSVLEMVKDLPKEFMPASLRRSSSYLQDTDHYKSPPLNANVSDETQKKADTSLVEPSSKQPSPSGSDAENGKNGSPQVSVDNNQKPVDPVTPSATPKNTAKRSQFNQPPGSNAGPRNRPATDSGPNIQTGEVQSGVSIHKKFESVGQAMVFGEVVHHSNQNPHQPFNSAHEGSQPPISYSQSSNSPSAAPNVPQSQPRQIVTAQVVRPASPPPIPGKAPTRSTASAQPKSKLKPAQRQAMNQVDSFLSKADRFAQNTAGVEQLSSLMGSWLVSAAVVLVVCSMAYFSFFESSPSAHRIRLESSTGSFTNLMQEPDANASIVWLFLVGLAGTITLLSISKVWRQGTGFSYQRLATLVVATIGVSAFAYSTMHALDAPVWIMGYEVPLFAGAMGDFLYELSSDGVGNDHWRPSFFGFLVYFSGILLLAPWWIFCAPLRSRRISWLLTVYLAGLAFLFSVFVNLYIPYSIFLAVSIGLGVQIGGKWITDHQRRQIQDLPS